MEITCRYPTNNHKCSLVCETHTCYSHHTLAHTYSVCVWGFQLPPYIYIHICMYKLMRNTNHTVTKVILSHTILFFFFHTHRRRVSQYRWPVLLLRQTHDWLFFGLHTLYMFPNLVEVARLLRHHLYTNTRTHNTHTRTRNHTHTPTPTHKLHSRPYPHNSKTKKCQRHSYRHRCTIWIYVYESMYVYMYIRVCMYIYIVTYVYIHT